MAPRHIFRLMEITAHRGTTSRLSRGAQQREEIRSPFRAATTTTDNLLN
jgi:hypothetical protein